MAPFVVLLVVGLTQCCIVVICIYMAILSHWQIFFDRRGKRNMYLALFFFTLIVGTLVRHETSPCSVCNWDLFTDPRLCTCDDVDVALNLLGFASTSLALF